MREIADSKKARDRDHGRTNVENHDYYRAKPYTMGEASATRHEEPPDRTLGSPGHQDHEIC